MLNSINLSHRSTVDLCHSLTQSDRGRALARQAQCRLDTGVAEAEEAAAVLREYKAARRKLREKQLRKRTCCVCAKTVPLSSHAFAYCGGCHVPGDMLRDMLRCSSFAREDLPRYCSEACQRAHWVAGHKDECPCAH